MFVAHNTPDNKTDPRLQNSLPTDTMIIDTGMTAGTTTVLYSSYNFTCYC